MLGKPGSVHNVSDCTQRFKSHDWYAEGVVLIKAASDFSDVFMLKLKNKNHFLIYFAANKK